MSSDMAEVAVLCSAADMDTRAKVVLTTLQERSPDAKAFVISRKAAASLTDCVVLVVMVPSAPFEGFDRFWRFLKKSEDRFDDLSFVIRGEHPELAAKLVANGARPLLDVPQEAEDDAWRDQIAAAAKDRLKPKQSAPAANPISNGERRGMAVLYGSQTGNAKSIAEGIGESVEAKGGESTVGELDSWAKFDRPLCAFETVVVVTSTTGNGDPPDGCEKFWRWARRREREAPNELGGVRFMILALGDTNYDKFCEVGKVLDRRIEELGGERVRILECADEAMGLESVVDPWIEDVYRILRERGVLACGGETKEALEDFELPSVVPVEAALGPVEASKKPRSVLDVDVEKALQSSPRALDERYLGRLVSVKAKTVSEEVVTEEDEYSSRRPLRAKVAVFRDLCSGSSDERRVVHCELEMPPAMKYEPGDIIGLCCPNRDEALAAVEGCGDEVKQLDLSAPPTRSIIRSLGEWCSDPEEKKACFLLASKPAGEALYDALVAKPRLRFYELVNMLPSLTLNADRLAAALPRMSARFYSIASSPLQGSNVAFAFSVVRYQTPRVEVNSIVVQNQLDRDGLCTTWLEANMMRKKEHFVDVFLKKSDAFKLPESTSAPLMMVGPGTGIAPFIGFVQHRAKLGAPPKAPVAALFPGSRPAMPGSRPAMPGSRRPVLPPKAPVVMGALTLYHGCRRREEDWLYRSEIEVQTKSGELSTFRLACSRDDKSKKVYVGDLILEDHEAVARHLTVAEGYVYICGDGSKMAKDVHAALKAALVKAGADKDEAAAQTRLENLKTTGKYLLDIWSPIDEYE